MPGCACRWRDIGEPCVHVGSRVGDPSVGGASPGRDREDDSGPDADHGQSIRVLHGCSLLLSPWSCQRRRPWIRRLACRVAKWLEINWLGVLEAPGIEPGSCECRGSDGARLERGRWRQRLARGRKPRTRASAGNRTAASCRIAEFLHNAPIGACGGLPRGLLPPFGPVGGHARRYRLLLLGRQRPALSLRLDLGLALRGGGLLPRGAPRRGGRHRCGRSKHLLDIGQRLDLGLEAVYCVLAVSNCLCDGTHGHGDYWAGRANVKLFGVDAGRRRKSSGTVHAVAKVVGPPPRPRRAAPTRAGA